MEQLERIPAQVRKVNIEGNDSSAASFLSRELEPLSHVNTISTLNDALAESIRNLHSTGLYSSVKMEVDTSPECKDDEVDVTVLLKEKLRYGASINTMHTPGGNGLSHGFNATVRNVFGHGERLTLSTSVNPSDTAPMAENYGNFSATLSNISPFKTNRSKAEVEIFRGHTDWAYMSSHVSARSGVSLALTDPTGEHRVGYSAAFREAFPSTRGSDEKPLRKAEVRALLDESPSADSSKAGSSGKAKASKGSDVSQMGPSHSILMDCLHPSFKSALTYTFTRDSRQPSRDAPMDGTLLSASVEAAGLGGDTSFVKAEAQAQKHRPVTPRVSVGVAAKAGIALPWSSFFGFFGLGRSSAATDSAPASGAAAAGQPASSSSSAGSFQREASLPPIPIMDRFVPSVFFVRGVSAPGLTPTDKRDALGGDLYASTSAMVSGSIPGYETLPIRPHAFVNAGSIVNVASDGSITARRDGLRASLGSTIASMWAARRFSLGAGIAVPLGGPRIEVNLASVYTPADGFSRVGFSGGVALDF